VTNGAADELQRATDIAEQMVTLYGMSVNLGPLSDNSGPRNVFLGQTNLPRRLHSEATGGLIDQEIRQLVERAYEQALAILQQNRDLLEAMTFELLAQEVIEGQELQDWLNKAQVPSA